MKIKNVLVIPVLLLVLTAVACGNSKSRNDRTETVDKEVIKAPEFNADSAYQYIQVQADFGPRVPNTQAHKECGGISGRTIGKIRSQGIQSIC